MEHPPVFLISSERSGTNLLRLRITENQDIYYGPEPAHLYKHLYHATPFYGDLNIEKNFSRLVSDALELCYNHFSPWKVKLNVNEIELEYNQNYKRRNSILLGHFLMQKYSLLMGYKSYFCKDNFLYDYVFKILYEIPDAKFIYLYRDPRDYTLSQKKRTLVTNNIYAIANMWKTEQIKCLSVAKQLNSEQIFILSYEDFITDEYNLLAKIFDFLNISFSTEIKKNNQQGYPEEWENLKKETIKGNYGKYKNALSKKNIRIIESITWNQLKELSYASENKSKPSISRYEYVLSRIYYIVKDHWKHRNVKKQNEFQWWIKRKSLLERIHRYR